MLGLNRRRVRRWEWETFMPNPGPLPQTSHTEATGVSPVRVITQGPAGQQDPARVAEAARNSQNPSRRRPRLAPVVDLRSPLRDLVRDKTAKVLEKGLGLRTCGDLLRHYPRRYVERGVLTSLADLREDEYVTVQAEIVSVAKIPFRNRTGQGRPKERVEVVVTDGRGKLKLTFFNQAWRSRQLMAGMQGLFAGKVGSFRGQAQLVNPQTQLLEEDGGADETLMTGLISVYPATAAMPSWNVAKAIRIALDVVDVGADPLPEEIREQHGLIPLA